MKLRTGIFLTLALTLFSCGKEVVQEIEEVAVLRSVEMIFPEEVVLPRKEAVEISFRVTDIGFSFSTPGDVVLYLASGQPATDFTLESIRATDDPGTYSAVIRDNGSGKDYNSEVRLGIRSVKGKDAFVFSQPFTVRSKESGLHGVTLHTGLPVIYLDTEEGKPIVSKEDYLSASLTLWDEESGPEEALACSVRGRGNTTWTWPKKPYLVKLDKKESMLGMKKHKRWILLANFMDRTMMRNMISMKVSSFTSLDWTPSCRPVELVLNGKHVGNYLLIEQVKVDKDRVPVTEMSAEDNSGEAVTGGYLLESDFHYDNEVQWIDPHGKCAQMGKGIPFGVKYPDPEDLTSQQLSYIKKYINDTAEALYGPDFKDPDKGYAAYIDVDSFIDYWIVFEVMGNHELGNPGSVYFHKDRGGKLKAGPCWDFDWGILSYNTSPHAKTGLVNGQAIWYSRLFEDPVFRERARARFLELKPQLETIPEYIESLRSILSESAGLNFKMWNPAEDSSQNNGQIINGDEYMSFDKAVDRIKTIFKERLSVISNNL